MLSVVNIFIILRTDQYRIAHRGVQTPNAQLDTGYAPVAIT